MKRHLVIAVLALCNLLTGGLAISQHRQLRQHRDMLRLAHETSATWEKAARDYETTVPPIRDKLLECSTTLQSCVNGYEACMVRLRQR